MCFYSVLDTRKITRKEKQNEEKNLKKMKKPTENTC